MSQTALFRVILQRCQSPSFSYIFYFDFIGVRLDKRSSGNAFTLGLKSYQILFIYGQNTAACLFRTLTVQKAFKITNKVVGAVAFIFIAGCI